MAKEQKKPKQHKNGINLDLEEVRASFQDPHWAQLYPPILSTQQAASLLQFPINTIYQMSSQGQFDNCARKVGKHLKFFRDRLVQTIFNQN